MSPEASPLSPEELRTMHAYWRAANYLSVGQIYLHDNPLLREPLQRAHVKPRLLGHWGTTPGLNLIYVHLNRVIKQHDLDMIYVIGPGHGGPALVANAYLEGTYSEVYPDIGAGRRRDAEALQAVQLPGRHSEPRRPGDPGVDPRGRRARLRAVARVRRRFRQPGPDRRVRRRRRRSRDRSARHGLALEQVPEPGARRRGPADPAPERLQDREPRAISRASRRTSSRASFEGYGYAPHFVEGDEPDKVHQALAAALDAIVADIRRIQVDARTKGVTTRPRWPMIVLQTPKGWTCPKEIDGKKCEGYWRAHQVPMADMDNPEHVRILEGWMKSYRPEELFDESGRLIPELAALPPTGHRRMSDNPHANGGLLLKDLKLPDFRSTRSRCRSPARRRRRPRVCRACSCAT